MPGTIRAAQGGLPLAFGFELGTGIRQAVNLSWDMKTTRIINGILYAVPDQLSFSLDGFETCHSTGFMTETSLNLSMWLASQIATTDSSFFGLISTSLSAVMQCALQLYVEYMQATGLAYCVMTTFKSTLDIDEKLQPSSDFRFLASSLVGNYTSYTQNVSNWNTLLTTFGTHLQDTIQWGGAFVGVFSMTQEYFHFVGEITAGIQAAIALTWSFQTQGGTTGGGNAAPSGFYAATNNTTLLFGGTPSSDLNNWFPTVWAEPSALKVYYRTICPLLGKIVPKAQSGCYDAVQNITGIQFLQNFAAPLLKAIRTSLTNFNIVPCGPPLVQRPME